ncbi:MAG: TonB-dependent receptor [Pseudomonadota bacterium]
MNKTSFYISLCLGILLSAFIGISAASATDEDVGQLAAMMEAPSIEEEIYFSPEEIVTGPTKREVLLTEAPANVTIITHEDIVQSGVTNLAEVFRRVPGMDVYTITAAETEVSARGFATTVLSGSRMAVLVDGRTFYLEFLGPTLWGQFPVPLADIKRIEVIKGPMSSLYGNRALLGIINIITYDPEETKTLLSGGGGRFYMAQGNFIHAGKFADGYWYKATGAYDRTNEYSDVAGDGTTKDRDDLRFQGEFLFQPIDPLRFKLTGGITQSSERLQFGGLSDWDDRRSVVDGRLSYDLGKYGMLHFQSYWQRHYISSKTYNMPSQDIDTVDAEIMHSIGFDIGKNFKNTTTYGFNYRLVDSSNQNISSLNSFAFFLQNESRFFDRVILTGGMRLDHQKDFAGTNISAQGSTVFLIHPKYTLRAGVATAFNTPTLVQYFLQFDMPISVGAFNTARFISNRNLKAERILYFEVGNTIKPIDKLTVRADFFYYRLNNMIIPFIGIVDPTTLGLSFINDGGVEAIGGELGVDGDILSWLSGYANWSYQDFDAINGNLNPTANLSNPKHKASAGLRAYWLNRRISANLDFNYVRHRMAQNGAVNTATTPAVQVNDLYLLNLRLGFWPIRDHLELAVAANNLLNDDSPQVPDFDPFTNSVLAERPKFNIWGSVKYVF